MDPLPSDTELTTPRRMANAAVVRGAAGGGGGDGSGGALEELALQVRSIAERQEQRDAQRDAQMAQMFAFMQRSQQPEQQEQQLRQQQEQDAARDAFEAERRRREEEEAAEREEEELIRRVNRMRQIRGEAPMMSQAGQSAQTGAQQQSQSQQQQQHHHHRHQHQRQHQRQQSQPFASVDVRQMVAERREAAKTARRSADSPKVAPFNQSLVSAGPGAIPALMKASNDPYGVALGTENYLEGVDSASQLSPAEQLELLAGISVQQRASPANREILYADNAITKPANAFGRSILSPAARHQQREGARFTVAAIAPMVGGTKQLEPEDLMNLAAVMLHVQPDHVFDGKLAGFGHTILRDLLSQARLTGEARDHKGRTQSQREWTVVHSVTQLILGVSNAVGHWAVSEEARLSAYNLEDMMYSYGNMLYKLFSPEYAQTYSAALNTNVGAVLRRLFMVERLTEEMEMMQELFKVAAEIANSGSKGAGAAKSRAEAFRNAKRYVYMSMVVRFVGTMSFGDMPVLFIASSHDTYVQAVMYGTPTSHAKVLDAAMFSTSIGKFGQELEKVKHGKGAS